MTKQRGQKKIYNNSRPANPRSPVAYLWSHVNVSHTRKDCTTQKKTQKLSNLVQPNWSEH